MNTPNWKTTTKSSEVLRQIEKLICDLTPSDRVRVVEGLALLATSQEELDSMIDPLMKSRQQLSG